MLNSVLLHLEGTDHAKSVIQMGVSLARQAEARVRGLTLLDTRRSEAAWQSDSAVLAVIEARRQAGAKQLQEAVRVDLSRACLEARLDFDVRQLSGDPLQILPQEARFHDLVITSVNTGREPEPGDLTPRDVLRLLARGVQPLLVVQAEQPPIERVLMVYDGHDAAGRAIRSFINLGILANAEHRLVAIGGDEASARTGLREMADYCAGRRSFETGCLTGNAGRVLLPYAEKWQADLIVLGVGPSNRLLRCLLGCAPLKLLRKLPCGLYVAA